MKIAILVWDLNIKGGTQRQALELALNLQNKGHKVDVFCYVYNKEKCFIDLCDKLNIYYVTSVDIGLNFNKINKFSFLKKLSRRIFFCNALFDVFFIKKSLKIYKKNIEKIHDTSYYDTINVHDYEIYKIARILKHKNIIWMMNDIRRAPAFGKFFIFNLIKKFLNNVLIKLEMNNINKIAVLDGRNKELCKKHYNLEAIVVRSGVDLDLFNSFTNDRVFKKDNYNIFASNIFYPHRRFEDIIDAVEILTKNGIKNINVTINGDNSRCFDYYLFIKNRIKEKKLDNYISIVNGVSEKKLLEYYNNSDIFIFPNHNQTWGLSVFEAMLSGCVCIVSRTSGASEVLTDSENAIIIEPKNPKEIADKILYLIKNYKKMEHISKKGVDFVKNNLSWESYMQDMLKIFNSV
ncbi:MAG: glycosyltransferase family 4 protein [Candidatus Falkowbacteria bacterium]